MKCLQNIEVKPVFSDVPWSSVAVSSFFSKALLCLSGPLLNAEMIISPEAESNTIAFEAEIGVIDNSFGIGELGWEVSAGTAPDGASEDFWITNTENETGTFPANTLSFDIDFKKTGDYTVYYRVAFTTDDFQDTRDGGPDNDSFYYDNGELGGDRNFFIQNSIPGLSNTEWVWRSGTANDISVGAPGVLEWIVSGREDGFILDRFVLVYEDETAVIDATFLESLSNAVVVPEPSSLAFSGFGLLIVLGLRRRP